MWLAFLRRRLISSLWIFSPCCCPSLLLYSTAKLKGWIYLLVFSLCPSLFPFLSLPTYLSISLPPSFSPTFLCLSLLTYLSTSVSLFPPTFLSVSVSHCLPNSMSLSISTYICISLIFSPSPLPLSLRKLFFLENPKVPLPCIDSHHLLESFKKKSTISFRCLF